MLTIGPLAALDPNADMVLRTCREESAAHCPYEGADPENPKCSSRGYLPLSDCCARTTEPFVGLSNGSGSRRSRKS